MIHANKGRARRLLFCSERASGFPDRNRQTRNPAFKGPPLNFRDRLEGEHTGRIGDRSRIEIVTDERSEILFRFLTCDKVSGQPDPIGRLFGCAMHELIEAFRRYTIGISGKFPRLSVCIRITIVDHVPRRQDEVPRLQSMKGYGIDRSKQTSYDFRSCIDDAIKLQEP